MQQPTLTVIKNFESSLSDELMNDDSNLEFSPKKFYDE
jgi:hypothetical protein